MPTRCPAPPAANIRVPRAVQGSAPRGEARSVGHPHSSKATQEWNLQLPPWAGQDLFNRVGGAAPPSSLPCPHALSRGHQPQGRVEEEVGGRETGQDELTTARAFPARQPLCSPHPALANLSPERVHPAHRQTQVTLPWTQGLSPAQAEPQTPFGPPRSMPVRVPASPRGCRRSLLQPITPPSRKGPWRPGD